MKLTEELKVPKRSITSQRIPTNPEFNIQTAQINLANVWVNESVVMQINILLREISLYWDALIILRNLLKWQMFLQINQFMAEIAMNGIPYATVKKPQFK